MNSLEFIVYSVNLIYLDHADFMSVRYLKTDLYFPSVTKESICWKNDLILKKSHLVNLVLKKNYNNSL